jgi:hypothetical protein
VSLPTIHVEIDFSSGPSFGYPLILDSLSFGILGTNILADGPLDLVDITPQVRQVSTRRGRNRILSQFEAGTATVVLNDPNSEFSPENTSSQFYGKLQPLRKIRIYAETEDAGSTVEVPIFAGYITSFNTNFYQGTTEDATVTLQCVDAFRLLANVATGTIAVPGTSSGQLSGARINSLLQFAGFPDSMLFLDPGQSQMQADPGGNRSILQAIQTIEQSEFGGFFASRSGKLIFLDRDTISKRSNSTPRTYSDVDPLPVDTYPYKYVDFAFDDQLILNKVSVSTLGGPLFTVQDNDSIATYFTKSGQRLDLLMLNPNEAQDQALTILADRKTAQLRVRSMTVNINDPINEENSLINLSMDIYTLIKVTKTMPGGSTVTIELFCQGVNHDITPSTWNMTVFTAEPLIQAFILDGGPQQDPTAQGVLALMSPVPNTNTLSY